MTWPSGGRIPQLILTGMPIILPIIIMHAWRIRIDATYSVQTSCIDTPLSTALHYDGYDYG